VAFLRDIKHPISVARLVMEKTPHIMLCGDGALEFALEQGFERENLLTEASRLDWEKWKETSEYRPVINIENHDTISMLLIDEQQNLFAACTTSGAAWKMHGRIGDSPIIGAGLFLDNEVGAAAATGLGEAVIRTAGSAMIVEAMRHGMSPDEACRMVVERISNLHKNDKDWENLQVGFIALNKRGVYGSYSLRPGFDFAVTDQNTPSNMVKAPYTLG
jgi:N4-(beta-N-acetylglucosaminyl)-L-asparaginase